jgi:SAM-dependent methyltransferase
MISRFRSFLTEVGLWLPLRSVRRRWRIRRQVRREFGQLVSEGANSRTRFELSWTHRYLILGDRTGNTGFDRHYVYHTAWAARILAQTRPARHLDIGSSLYFCAIVSAFVPVDFQDFRPANLKLDGLSAGAGDLTALALPSGSVHSLSCMHTVEHVGLGRYGDPVDYDGDLKAIRELKRVLAPGGDLLFVVPVGSRSRIHFNAHRIYTRDQVREYFRPLELREFTLIPEQEADGGLVPNPGEDLLVRQQYGCGCFWFRRPA